MDSVAKIILSDWVRGRIPFFVPPPERSETLNRVEEKARKVKALAAKDVKGKGKALDDGGKEGLLPGVKQNLGSIMQKNTFLAEDIQPLEEEFTGEGVDEEEEEDENGSGDDAEADAGANDDTDEELTWNDVFEGIQQTPDESHTGAGDTHGGQGKSTLPIYLLYLMLLIKIPHMKKMKKNRRRRVKDRV